MANRDRTILKKVLSECEIVQDLLAGFDKEAFLADERTKRAVCMTFVNIGELVKNLSSDLTSTRRDIPWRNIAGMRDITAHKYQTLNMEDVYTTAVEDIPQLKDAIREMILE